MKTGVMEFLQPPEPPAWAVPKDRLPHDLYDQTTERSSAKSCSTTGEGAGRSTSANVTNKHRTFGADCWPRGARAGLGNPASSPLTIQTGLWLSFGMALPENVEVRVDGPVNHGAGSVVGRDRRCPGHGRPGRVRRRERDADGPVHGGPRRHPELPLGLLVETTGDELLLPDRGHFCVLGYPSHYPEGPWRRLSGYRP